MGDVKAEISRRDQVADAALRVLGESGSRGLTHRAVDAAAGLPSGTTTIYFHTRCDLLEAALALHVEIDTPPEPVLAEIARLELTDEEALELMMVNVERLLANENLSMLKARYELVLEASRNADLHRTFEPARERFVGLAESVLTARGCSTPREHGTQLIAVLDGILMDSLIGASSRLDREAMRELLARQLASC